MSTQLPFSLGSEQLFFCAKETAWGTYQDWTAADGLAVLKSEFGTGQGRTVRKSTRNTRSALDRYTMRKEATWSVDTELAPGAVGVAPDCGPLLECLLGTETIVGGTSVTYSAAKTQCPSSLQLTRSVDVGQQTMNGCVVMEGSIEAGEVVKASFSGGAIWHTFMNAILVSGTSGASTVTALDQDMADQIDENSKIVIAGTAGDDGPFTVTDVTGTTITLDGNLTADHTAVPMKPWRPTPTTTGQPATQLLGSLTLDGGEVDFSAFKVTIANNSVMHNKQVGYDRASYAYHLRRAVTFTLGIHWRRDMGHWYDVARRFEQAALVWTFGADTAGGSLWTISMPYCELDLVDANIPEPDGDVGIFSFTGTALASASGEDEISISIT